MRLTRERTVGVRDGSVRRVPVVDARNDLAEILNRVAYGKERVVLTRRDKDVVAIVSLEDLRLIQQLEDRIDLAEAKKVLARNEPTISLDELKEKYSKKPAARSRQSGPPIRGGTLRPVGGSEGRSRKHLPHSGRDGQRWAVGIRPPRVIISGIPKRHRSDTRNPRQGVAGGAVERRQLRDRRMATRRRGPDA